MRQFARLYLSTTFIAHCVLTSSCANVDGTDPYAFYDTFTHLEGKYTFKYLSPPWIMVNVDGETDVQIIAIDPSLDEIDTAVESGPINARFKATVSLCRTCSARETAELDLKRISGLQKEDNVTEQFPNCEMSEFVNNSGHKGFHIKAISDERYIRFVYIAISEDMTVIMRLVSRQSVSGDDFTLLLKGLEPLEDTN